MATVLLAIVVVLLSVAGLATGILAGRQPLRGSCGARCGTRPECVGCSHIGERNS